MGGLEKVKRLRGRKSYFIHRDLDSSSAWQGNCKAIMENVHEITEEGLVAGGRARETGPGLELLTTPDLVNRLFSNPSVHKHIHN